MSKRDRLAKLQKLRTKKDLIENNISALRDELSEVKRDIGKTFPVKSGEFISVGGVRYVFDYADGIISDTYSVYAFKIKKNGEPYSASNYIGRFSPSEFGEVDD